MLVPIMFCELCTDLVKRTSISTPFIFDTLYSVSDSDNPIMLKPPLVFSLSVNCKVSKVIPAFSNSQKSLRIDQVSWSKLLAVANVHSLTDGTSHS